jgi:hypothetical protein
MLIDKLAEMLHGQPTRKELQYPLNGLILMTFR